VALIEGMEMVELSLTWTGNWQEKKRGQDKFGSICNFVPFLSSNNRILTNVFTVFPFDKIEGDHIQLNSQT